MLIFLVLLVFFMCRTLAADAEDEAARRSRHRRSSGVRWDDIAGVEGTKDELREVVEFLSDPKRFKTLGAKVPKGILLHGPPGTGKTMLAKAVAHESGANFFSQSASSFVEMFAGLGAARIRRLFKEARENAPAILFIDELDAVGAQARLRHLRRARPDPEPAAGRDGRLRGRRQHRRDGRLEPAREARHGAAAARPLRPPGLRAAARPRAAASRSSRSTPATSRSSQDIDLHRVAQHTSGLTGADLANLCNEAAIQAGRATRRVRSARSDFDNAFERVVAGLQQPQGDHSPREARRRLARGRSRARLRAAADRRQGPEGLDRPPRQGARLHAQPAARRTAT